MTPHDAYASLIKRLKQIATLSSTGGVLHWDQITFMPSEAGAYRAEQLAQIHGLIHGWLTDPHVGEWLATIEQSDLIRDPESAEAVNVRETRRIYDRETKLPADFVEDFTRTTVVGRQVWGEARKKSDFSMFAPHLKKTIDLCRRKADLIGFTTERYDALIDEFEPGANAADIETAFAGLRTDLVELIGKIKDAPRRPDLGILKRPWDVVKQKIFAEITAAAIGYNFNAGRIDETTHPCCNGLGPRDIRILTRFYPEDLAEGLTGTVHETGHAMYDLSRDVTENWGLPIGETASLAIHESQSRTWENIVGRSRSFWIYFFPQLQRLFHEEARGVTLDEFYGVMNWVAPSHIRVEADEATYNLHIMLRFELERAIIKGEIEVDAIPSEWNRRFKNYLGIEVDSDAHGCLQDVHWSDGSFGYFPTYALGNLYAAQFWTKAKKDLPGLENDFATGRFDRMLTWLRDNIHIHGFRYHSGDLCKKVTGESLSHRPLLDYLYDKYEGIYGIKR